ncbi:hypothetical protein A33Q_0035 [Indibacter alkaliphilus LW1]|uniref:Uncharacterized protein n=1 Tax=Indibacter alkaliphilus (strain CCUG 57479 / KCTC 22604 / LW1) TaxID=1189612 RepID=S2E7H7_INDAL|nr:hypothetical protein A33Q_0035 [Indibacter alkaliphilus LW1]
MKPTNLVGFLFYNTFFAVLDIYFIRISIVDFFGKQFCLL